MLHVNNKQALRKEEDNDIVNTREKEFFVHWSSKSVICGCVSQYDL